MHEIKKYFENSMITRIIRALRIAFLLRLQLVVCRVRCDIPVWESVSLYQYPTRTSMAEASNAAIENHPTACCP